MDDFSLIVNLPEVADEKQMKELRSSLENLLNDYFSAFSHITAALEKDSRFFQCGTAIEFENGRTFQILFTRQAGKDHINVGMVNDYGICDRAIEYKEALIVNKYALEMSTRIHEQRIVAYNNMLNGSANIGGVYSVPEAAKIPIYKSMDSDYNFIDGLGKVLMKHGR